jgi:hypothetical protein
MDDLELRNHVLAINKLGKAVDPETGQPVDNMGDYLNDLLQNMDQVTSSFSCKAGNTTDGREQPVRRILIHVHGGLNTHESTKRNAINITNKILNESEDNLYYPIFVAWPSGGLSSYWEHLFILRQGRRSMGIGMLLWLPYLVTDLARGIVRAPISLTYQLMNDVVGALSAWFGWRILPSWKNADSLLNAANKYSSAYPNGKYNIQLGKYQRTNWYKIKRFLIYIITFPVKLLTQILLLDAAAQGAWNVMLHRVRNLFRTPEEFDIRNIRDNEEEISKHLLSKPSGALVEFLKGLTEHITNKNEVKYEVTLVGHSMGAIVINQSLRYLLPEVISRIIYMAPACTIREASDAIVPFLQDKRSANFHVLTLHPSAEVEEMNGFDLIPRGSLLEWIDHWYTSPHSHTYRRLGKWVNMIQAIHLFEDVREQVTFKGFEVIEDKIPQKHGQFNDGPFWRQEFWDPQGPKSFERVTK